LREKSNFNKYRLKIHGRLAGKTQKNKDYFKGPGNTKRVQQWREVSPKYQDNKKSVVKSLQD